jgi:hypothetical protein
MTDTNRARGRPEITVRRVCEACANRAARRDGRDQLCLICATLTDFQPDIRTPARRVQEGHPMTRRTPKAKPLRRRMPDDYLYGPDEQERDLLNRAHDMWAANRQEDQ